ncbi:uncharacterized protein LOC134690688 [Mytilus trossulus]|uniref:uncharacterized protein LOC134690688 n=1 Tax=Mytilus trossulus TaxID=6551 RepID=UPI00300424F2
MFTSAVPRYILPTMTQYQRNVYAPTQMAQMKTIPIGIFTTISLTEDSQLVGNASNCSYVDEIISAFNDILYGLTLCADNLEETSDIILQILNNCSDETILTYFVESLFEKCISDTSFQNTGAKLVQYLICKSKTTQAFANFRNLFLLRCKEEYLKSSETILRLCRLAIFIGELFFNQGVADGHIVQGIPVLMYLIKSMLLVLLEHSTDVTVSCAVQILKDADICRPDKKLFSEVFLFLQELQSCNHLSSKTTKSIACLLDPLGQSGLSELPQVSSITENELPLTASMLAEFPQQEQKQLLGERLFPLIQSMYPVLAGKITGMLLEIDNFALLHMLELKESLESKVQEAVGVLQAHQATETATTAIEGQPNGMMSQMFPSAGPGYILPTMTHGQINFFVPTQVPHMRASPRWPIQLRQPTPASGFQNMPGQQVRLGNPAAAGARQPGQGNIRGGMNARPITGQSGTGQPPRMPQSLPGRGQVPPPAVVMNPASRYSATQMRNSPQTGRHQNMVMPQPPARGGVIQVQGQGLLTSIMLADAPQQEQKQMLGERLFPLIQCMYPDLAKKITGMLLEIDNSELLHILESKESLEATVNEAVAVLQAHQAKITTHATEAAN